MPNDLVSIIIPCYNYAHFLGEAIESVLDQTHHNFEIIVVDNGSSDNTSEVAIRYPDVRLLRLDPNKGVSIARNTGLHESRGEYVVFLDADDRLLSHALEAGLKCLKEHPECAFVCGHFSIIAADGTLLDKSEHPFGIGHDLIVTLMSWRHFIMPGAVIFKRSVFGSVSGFNPSFQGGEDYELFFRIAWKFPVYWHDELVLQYRKHDQSFTLNYGRLLRDGMEVLYLQRKHIKGNKRLEEAYRTGIRACQAYYNKELGKKIHGHISRREWRRALQDVLTLLRYYPRGFMKLFLPGSNYALFRYETTVKRLLLRRRNDSIKGCPDPNYEGYLDNADCETIEGWAWDASNPDIPVAVDILVDGKLLAKVPADGFRKDLSEAGKSDGCHAFCYHTPYRLKDGKPHTILAKIMGKDAVLVSSPKEIQCTSEMAQKKG